MTEARRRQVLVCGGTGFIGRNLVERYRERADVCLHATCFQRPPIVLAGVTWHRVDLRQPERLGALLDGMDVVIQAAATTSGAKDIVQRPFIHVTDNAIMNSALLRAAFEQRVGQFVFFSCSNMLSDREEAQDETAWDPSLPLNPRYFGIGWTKAYIEKMCAFFAEQGVTRHAVIRHSNTYGPHDKFDLERSHMLGATITKTMTASGNVITVWGDGSEKRDLIYIDDLVDLVEAVVERQTDPFDLIHAGAGVGVSVADVVRLVVEASGRFLEIRHDLDKPTIKSNVVLDTRHARDRYGWSPRVPLAEGIARTIAWWKAKHGPKAGSSGGDLLR